MKRLLILFLICTMVKGTVAAQSDLKVMLKQIALIAVHVKELENAIEIAREGLTTINEIKNGEFNLHSLFFSSLKSVNPAVAKYSRIAVIIADQAAIIADFKKLLQRIRTSNRITHSELSYIETVYTNLADQCAETLNDLITVTTSGKLEMTDDERIQRINVIAKDMKDKYALSQDFISATDKLVNERDAEDKELKLLKTLE